MSRSASFLQHNRNSRRNRQVVESVQAVIIRANIDDPVDYSSGVGGFAHKVLFAHKVKHLHIM